MLSALRLLAGRSLAEALGTFIMVFLGLGAIHSSLLTGSQAGIWQVAVVWGLGLMLAIYVVGAISGGHLNPAITLALFFTGRFSWKEVVPYVLAQVAGAFLAAAALFLLYAPFLEKKEKEFGVTRGSQRSEITGMCYACYYPSPTPMGNIFGDSDLYREHRESIGLPAAIAAELLGTLLLALVVFATTDDRFTDTVVGQFAPVFIGLTLAGLIVVIAPLTQGAFNPARDLGPRLFAAYLGGWDRIALPGPRGWDFLYVYAAAPVAGAVLGAVLYVFILRPALAAMEDDKR